MKVTIRYAMKNLEETKEYPKANPMPFLDLNVSIPQIFCIGENPFLFYLVHVWWMLWCATTTNIEEIFTSVFFKCSKCQQVPSTLPKVHMKTKKGTYNPSFFWNCQKLSIIHGSFYIEIIVLWLSVTFLPGSWEPRNTLRKPVLIIVYLFKTRKHTNKPKHWSRWE